MEGINVRIELTGRQTPEGSHWLGELRSELQQELEISCHAETTKAPEGTMAVDITTAIAIASLTLNVIGTLLTVLEHRRKQSNRNSMTVTGENYNYTVSNLTDKEREKILQDIEQKKLKDVIIKVND